jgi:hypothetical protein
LLEEVRAKTVRQVYKSSGGLGTTATAVNQEY